MSSNELYIVTVGVVTNLVHRQLPLRHAIVVTIG